MGIVIAVESVNVDSQVGDTVTVRKRERKVGETEMQVVGGVGGGATSNNRTGRWYLSISMNSGLGRAFQSI